MARKPHSDCKRDVHGVMLHTTWCRLYRPVYSRQYDAGDLPPRYPVPDLIERTIVNHPVIIWMMAHDMLQLVQVGEDYEVID